MSERKRSTTHYYRNIFFSKNMFYQLLQESNRPCTSFYILLVLIVIAVYNLLENT